jgi:glyceraldehyde-3-phosphate dehydrogenase/erythrose-4-phosphate dehydrogenase
VSWRDLGIDLVVECSGKVKQRGGLDVHLQNGARHVLVSNPVPGARNLVVGVNDAGIDIAREAVVTAASCTTNCLAPIVRVLHDAIGIARGLVTTVHDPTNTQGVVDRADADPRRGRSALLNLIPTTTNSATAVVEIVPELAGKLDSIAVRAPVLNASRLRVPDGAPDGRRRGQPHAAAGQRIRPAQGHPGLRDEAAGQQRFRPRSAQRRRRRVVHAGRRWHAGQGDGVVRQ